MKRGKLSRRDILRSAATLAAGSVFAAPVRAQAPEPVAITPALVEAAKREAKVILYSSMDLPVGEKLGKAFEAVAMDASEVVAAGLTGLDRNRAIVIPGLINKAGAVGAKFAPRSLVRKIAGAIKY